MPYNSIKSYPELLEIAHLSVTDRRTSLYAIFKRDVIDNDAFTFRGKIIKPIKKEGMDALEILYTHLTCEEKEEIADDGRKFKKRYFEIDRSVRLHWVKPHLDEKIAPTDEVVAFSVEERDVRRKKDVIKTYIFNKTKKYIIVLEPQRSPTHYYILTAYYLNKAGGEKSILKKLKNKLVELH